RRGGPLRRARRPVGRPPILWKVRHVEGVAPLTVLQNTPRWLALLAVAGATALVGGGILYANLAPGVTPGRALGWLARGDFATWAENLNDAAAARGFQLLSVVVLLVAGGLIGMRCSAPA